MLNELLMRLLVGGEECAGECSLRKLGIVKVS